MEQAHLLRIVPVRTWCLRPLSGTFTSFNTNRDVKLEIWLYCKIGLKKDAEYEKDEHRRTKGYKNRNWRIKIGHDIRLKSDRIQS
jgi:hypothetical protein